MSETDDMLPESHKIPTLNPLEDKQKPKKLADWYDPFTSEEHS